MIKNVRIIPGCIACKTCENICPQVFHIEGTSRVIGYDFEKYRQAVLRAERMCPVNVIKVDRDDTEAVAEAFAEATLIESRYLTRDVLALSFGVREFSAVAGQYVSVRLRDSDGEFVRSYSLVEFSAAQITLWVKILPDGRGGRVLSSLAAGDRVGISEALGHFVVAEPDIPHAFVATGTGLAPVIPMLRALPADTPKLVFFGVRTQADVFAADILSAIPNTRTIITCSRPSDAWSGERGRVTDHLQHITSDMHVSICGNPAMVDAVERTLTDR